VSPELAAAGEGDQVAVKEAPAIVEAIRDRAARRAGLQYTIIPLSLSRADGQLVWIDKRDYHYIRVLMAEHGPCVVCGRQTRWASTNHGRLTYPRYCSYACLRTRPP
jgi:hypothetical protein